MTDLQSSGAATGTGDRSRPRAVLPALCVTQIASWGILYYAFPVLNPAITADTGWGTGTTTAAFSAALVVSALAGIHVGRVLDRRGPRTVMTAGSVPGVLSLLLERGYTTTQAAWALGLGGAGQTLGRTLYAALSRRLGVTARTVTLIGLGAGPIGGYPALFALLSAPSILAAAAAFGTRPCVPWSDPTAHPNRR